MAEIIRKWWRRIRSGEPIYVVSGLPRSGTSMMMKMLAAGGLELVKDDVRTPDEDNPRGYFELERVKDLLAESDKSWLRGARGKGIKIISQLLETLPEDNFYKVLFMERDLDEVLASQAKMLDRRGEEAGSSSDAEMKELFTAHLDKVRFILRRRPHFEVRYFRYSDVVSDPESAASDVNEFLGGGMSVDEMRRIVEPQLYRNRAD